MSSQPLQLLANRTEGTRSRNTVHVSDGVHEARAHPRPALTMGRVPSASLTGISTGSMRAACTQAARRPRATPIPVSDIQSWDCLLSPWLGHRSTHRRIDGWSSCYVSRGCERGSRRPRWPAVSAVRNRSWPSTSRDNADSTWWSCKRSASARREPSDDGPTVRQELVIVEVRALGDRPRDGPHQDCGAFGTKSLTRRLSQHGCALAEPLNVRHLTDQLALNNDLLSDVTGLMQ